MVDKKGPSICMPSASVRGPGGGGLFLHSGIMPGCHAVLNRVFTADRGALIAILTYCQTLETVAH